MLPLRQSYLSRGVALFFILFTFVDLSMPEFCSEELGGRSLPMANSTASFYDSHELSLSPASDHSERNKTGNSEHADEDCFCCCAHIVPGKRFKVDVVELDSFLSETADISLPTSPPDTPFHPPRLA
jgi:hypothetical protein